MDKIKIYCKKSYIDPTNKRYYYKHKTYYVDKNIVDGENIFVFLSKDDIVGRWFNNRPMNNFQHSFRKYFTTNKNLLREEKIKRILNEDN